MNNLQFKWIVFQLYQLRWVLDKCGLIMEIELKVSIDDNSWM